MSTSSPLRLWSVHPNDHPHPSVVSTPDEGRARQVVQALQSLGDLPGGAALDLRPCPGALARRTARAARLAEVGQDFLAFLGGGVFITHFCGGTP